LFVGTQRKATGGNSAPISTLSEREGVTLPVGKWGKVVSWLEGGPNTKRHKQVGSVYDDVRTSEVATEWGKGGLLEPAWRRITRKKGGGIKCSSLRKRKRTKKEGIQQQEKERKKYQHGVDPAVDPNLGQGKGTSR